jgi:hypothetical protein
MVLALFIVLKLSVYREYIFFGTFLLFIDMFYELYKIKSQKKKQSGEKFGCLRKSSYNYGYCWSSCRTVQYDI